VRGCSCQALKLRKRTHGNQPALVDDADTVRQFLGHFQAVRGKKNSDSAPRPLPNELLEEPRPARIESYHRFIQHQDPGLVNQRGG